MESPFSCLVQRKKANTAKRRNKTAQRAEKLDSADNQEQRRSPRWGSGDKLFS
jgi:hypothetical protein